MLRQKTSFLNKLPFLCWPTLVLICISWLPYLRRLTYDLSFGDEGIVLQGAFRIYNGELPFRDFFTALPPGVFYYYALIFKLFSPDFLVMRAGVAAVSLMLILTLWYILARLSVRAFPPYLLTGAFLAYFGGPCWFVASHHWLASLFCMLSLALLLPAEGKSAPASGPVFISGVLAGAATFTLQHRGGFWILAATAAILLCSENRAQMIKAFYCGILLFVIPVGIFFITTVSFDILYYDLVTFLLSQYGKIEQHGLIGIHPLDMLQRYLSGFSRIAEPGMWLHLVVVTFGLLGMFSIYLLPVAALFSLYFLAFKCHEKRFVTAMLASALIASYLATLHRLSDTTLFFAAAPAILVISLQFARSKADAGLKIISLLFICIAVGYSILAVSRPTDSVNTPAGVVQTIYPEDRESLNTVLQFSKAGFAATDQVFCYPYIPIYYYLFHLKNPSQFDTLTYPMHTVAQMRSVEQDLEKYRTRWIIINGFQKKRLSPDISIEKYIAMNYEIRATSPYATILERRLDNQ